MFAMLTKPLRRIGMLLRRRAPQQPPARPSLECAPPSGPSTDPWATVVPPPPADPYQTTTPAPKAGETGTRPDETHLVKKTCVSDEPANRK